MSERSERVPQPQKSSASAAVKKAPMRRVLWYFLSAQKVRNPSVTLYGSNGATVAHKVGEGSEIFLHAESKGIHILVLNIDGKEYTKKVAIK